MCFKVRPAKGLPLAVGVLMSTMHLCSMDKVPELVAWLADDGRMMCKPSWFPIVTEVLCENENCRIRDLSAAEIRADDSPTTSLLSSPCASSSGVDERKSAGVVAKLELLDKSET